MDDINIDFQCECLLAPLYRAGPVNAITRKNSARLTDPVLALHAGLARAGWPVVKCNHEVDF